VGGAGPPKQGNSASIPEEGRIPRGRILAPPKKRKGGSAHRRITTGFEQQSGRDLQRGRDEITPTREGREDSLTCTWGWGVGKESARCTHDDVFVECRRQTRM